jgi:ATP-binding cassette subfamily G (WHITE) protein 2
LDPDEKREQTALNLNDLYIKSNIYASIQQEIKNFNNQKVSTAINEQSINSKSRLSEILYVCQRTLRNVYRNPALVLMQTVVTIIFAVLVGLIYLQIDDTQETGVKNRLGAIFFITINQVMSNLSSIDLFIKERVFFIHENASGYYHVSTYFIAKLLCDLIPLRIIPSILFSSIVYFMIGFQPTVEKFFIFYLAVFITVLCAVALCFFISASVQVFGIASLLSVMSFVLMMVFGGFLVELSSIVSFLSWIRWISIFRYTMNIITINEFSGLELCLKNNSTSCINGIDIIHNVSHIEYETQWDLWKNFVALGSMMMIFFSLAYLQLLRMKKTK